ncbi:MAG: YXWGXW repeat-containing protein [Thermodesulfobacteriota bacterium]
MYVPPPPPQHIWIQGYWAWNGRWVWQPGYWVIPPRPYAKWVLVPLEASARWLVPLSLTSTSISPHSAGVQENICPILACVL